MSNDDTQESNTKSAKWLRPFSWLAQQLIAVFHYLFEKPLKALLLTLLFILTMGWIVKSWDPRQVIEIDFFEIAEMDSVSMEEETFENMIEDRLAEIQRVLGDTSKLSLGAEAAVAEESVELFSNSSILKNKNLLEDVQGDNQNGLDIGGFSVDRLRYEWRRFRYDIISISGDVVVDEDQTLQVFMREDKYHKRWKLSGHPANFTGVEQATKELADSVFTHLFPYAMGYYYVKTKDLEKAAKTFKYVRKDHPRFVESQIHIADLYAVLGESDKAVAYYENSSSEEPENESLRLKKVDALIQSAQNEKAEKELIKLSNEADDEGIRSYAKAKLALIDTNRSMEDEIAISESIISGQLDISDPEVFDELKDIQSDTIFKSLAQKAESLNDESKINVLKNVEEVRSGSTREQPSSDNSFTSVIGSYWPYRIPTPTNTVPLDRQYYCIAYDTVKRIPVYVIYELAPESLESDNKPDRYYLYDHNVPKEWQASRVDYSGSGFDRGHLASMADFYFVPNTSDYTNIYTNLTPQYSELNRGVWYKLEAAVRELVKDSGPLYVISGVIDSETTNLMKGRVAIPEYFYKIIVRKKSSTEVWVSAYLIPNQPGLTERDYAKFGTTLSNLKEKSNVNFFNNLTIKELPLQKF